MFLRKKTMSKDDVCTYLKEIRRQLWLGHASLMVGSGFSKNAIKTTPATLCPPNWEELATALVTRLYPSCDEKQRKLIQLKKNVLQLAEEFDTTFQRPELNEFLKNLIQDDNLLPSSLHRDLLSLPWADVFTTNYDTLLERAAKEVINIKYDIVATCRDLPYSEAPRIIKLHGSFPSESTHLIVTEEDYRTYPYINSPFVNSVQQAVMETTMCLIGFSGTDPNFQNWIGWVKDNLHDSMPPIYLIGLLGLSQIECKVLEKKNIIPVDLSEWNDSSNLTYTEVLEKFLDFMHEKPSYVDWPKNSDTQFNYFSPKTSQDEVINVINSWAKQRKTYPHWLYLSWQSRSNLQIFTEQWTYSLDYLKILPDNWDIRGLYELNWRLEKCLMPIPNNLINDYEAILNKYDYTSLLNEKANEELIKMWLELCFAILRWSREELRHDIWNRYEKILTEVIGSDSDYQNHLFFEKISYAMAFPNLDKVDELIQEWDRIAHPLIWKVKFAALLAELGEIDKAIHMWEEALNELRPNIPKSKIKDDFYLLGIEGCILVNLGMAETYNNIYKQISNKNIKDKKRSSKIKPQNNYRERLNELRQYECNPWDNIERFSLVLSSSENADNNTHIYRDFDKIKTTNSFHNGWSTELVSAYQFIRFFEETGIAFQVGNVNISKKTLQLALPHIASVSPALAFCILNRIGMSNQVSCELFFSQEKLASISSNQVNTFLDGYIEQLRYIIDNKKDLLRRLNDNFYKKTAKNLYEAISRLTIKASAENLSKILNLGIRLYKTEINNKYNLFENLGTKYFNRLLDAMKPEQIFQNLQKILSIKIPFSNQVTFWQSPISNIDWRGFSSSAEQCPVVLKEIIDDLIQQLNNSNIQYRFNILLYLNTCISINILTQKQKKILANTLSKYILPNGVIPKDYFYKFVYMDFLAPIKKKIDIIDILKKYYLESSKNIFQINNGELSVSIIESAFIAMANSLITTCSVFNSKQKYYFNLSEEETVNLFQQIKITWDNQKQYIINWVQTSKQKVESTLFYNEFKDSILDTFIWIDKILGEVIIPRIKHKKTIREILNFIAEVEELFDLPCTEISLLSNRQKLFDDKIIYNTLSAFSSLDNKIFDSYAYSLFNAYRFAKNKCIGNPPMILLHTLINAIGIRSDACFRSACNIVGMILDYINLDKTTYDILLLYLNTLIDQTDFANSANRFTKADRYDYRKSSAFLAVKMYCFCLNKKIDIPSVLLKWNELAQSNKEFPSIRNIWMREVNKTISRIHKQ